MLKCMLQGVSFFLWMIARVISHNVGVDPCQPKSVTLEPYEFLQTRSGPSVMFVAGCAYSQD